VNLSGSQVNITVSLKNRSLIHAFQNVRITASIADSKGTVTASWHEVIPFTIQYASNATYTFAMPYTVPNDTTYSITVSILDENGLRTDNYPQNDTIGATISLKPHYEFVAPFVPDTLLLPFFTVHARISSWAGATVSPPKMIVASTTDGTTSYDTITMIQMSGENWQANIPQQHYGSNVVYSLHLSDTIGNSLTLLDSTYIRDLPFLLGDTTITGFSLLEPFITTPVVCSHDSLAVKVALQNKSTVEYNFAKDTIAMGYLIIDPLQTVSIGMVAFAGSVPANTVQTIELLPVLLVSHVGNYTIKVWISNPSGNTLYRDTLSYTYVSLATVTTVAATTVSQTAATLHGKVLCGSAAITTGFEYKEASASSYTPVTVTLSNDSILTHTLNGLTPNTTYQYRAYAVYTTDTVYGGVEPFTTQPTIGIATVAAENGIGIYPNPVKDAISIVLPENITQASFSLYDIQGKQLLQQDIRKDNTVSVAHLSSGMYIYAIVTDGKRMTGKIVKQ
jgi:hypothetical protein